MNLLSLKYRAALVLVSFPLLQSAAVNPCQVLNDGLRQELPSKTPHGARTIQLQVISPDIIRVTASASSWINLTPGLMCDYTKPAIVPFRTAMQGDTIVLTTDSLRVYLSVKTGQLSFRDYQGRLLLEEIAGGGKTLTPVNVDRFSGYTLQQVFESPDEEAFFGLGQHQSNVLNYKGKNETLYQYNTKVSMPFIVSNHGYGLLWNNYSLTRFGDPRPYENLNVFRLYDAHGNKGGLTATYYLSSDTSSVFLRRQEAIIDCEDLQTMHRWPSGYSLRNGYVTWEGFLEPDKSGTYAFDLYYAGYISVFLNDSLYVKERWRTAWNPNHYPFEIALKKGEKYALRLQWKPDGDVSYLGLKVLPPRPLQEKNQWSLWSEMGKQLDYYFIRGQSMDRIISGYRTLTGKAQVMPKWAMGFWQSRERYKTQDELLSTLHTFRQRQIPVDNIVLDWFYWKENDWGSHEFDAVRFPDPKGMVQAVHADSAHIMLSVWPKFYVGTTHFNEFDSRGWLYRKAIEDSIRDWVGKGYLGTFYDAYNPEARALYWKQLQEHLYPKGFDAWWLDADEPDILSNASIAYRKQLMHPTALGAAAEYFNAYGLMHVKGVYEGQRAANDSSRVFILSRSGFAGSQRYAACIWSGDIAARWEDLRAQIPAGLNFSLSGNPYWTMDDGGFCVEKRYERAPEGSEDREEWRELQVRWHQFGAFAPLFRSHGQYPYREIWHIAPETHPAYAAMVYYNQLRYRLMPYIYTLAGQCYLSDYTIMRALVMDFPSDKQSTSVDDQYLFGPSLLVCPVYMYQARKRAVYFPAGTDWYRLYDGQYVKGGQWQDVEAPYERMPVYVAAGSLLPIGRLIQQTSTPQLDLTWYVYAGKDGHFTLYEDEGTNYNYEKGKYSLIECSWNDQQGVFQIGNRQGSYAGMPLSRLFHIILVEPDSPAGLDTPTVREITVNYQGKALEIPLRVDCRTDWINSSPNLP